MILSADDLRWYRSKACLLLDGAFDPLHAGHVQYFRDAAKAFPGYLTICAIASDDDIRAKGREPLLDQRSRAQVVQALKTVDLVLLKTEPTEHIIGKLQPAVYIKGADWEGRLPPEQLAACALHHVQIVYLPTEKDSSTERLRTWALKDAEAGLARLERFTAAQKPASTPWQPVTDYSFRARAAAEGKHPDLIVDVFQPRLVLDAGCGFGHLVRMLRERGIEAYGFDLNPYVGPNGHWFDQDDLCSDAPLDEWNTTPLEYDLVINRECLEHLTVTQVGKAVKNLFRLSSKFVYITTRFSNGSVFDAATDFDTDPTHITCLTQPFLRSLCVLNGGKRRKDLEQKLDHQNKGRVLVYELQ